MKYFAIVVIILIFLGSCWFWYCEGYNQRKFEEQFKPIPYIMPKAEEDQ